MTFLSEKVTALQDYVLLDNSYLFGTVNFIFVKKGCAQNIRKIQKRKRTFGKFGIAAKGATSIELEINDTSVMFVNCHLPSGGKEEDVQNRADKSSQIIDWFKFEEIDLVFWGGDFNLRTFTDFDHTKVYQE